MQFFDLHCDTLYKAVKENSSLNNPEFEVSIEKGKTFSKWCQCMALWLPDGLAQNEMTTMLYKAYGILQHDSESFDIKCFDVNENDNHSFIFTLENGAILDNDINNVSLLKKHNVKMVTLTWNDRNCIGGGADTQKFGLTDFGKICVKELENQGIIIDVSHSSDKTFYDVLSCTKNPPAASHSNSRRVCDHRRNLTDEQFLSIVKRKGIVGINFHKEFLNTHSDKASIADVIKHTEYFLSLGGEDAVCIGSDFDGADPVCELSSIEKIGYLYESYLRIGYNEQLVQKIMYNNAYNFFCGF